MNALARQLSEEIRRNGPMPFAEFMQRALYDPAHGYYSRAENQIGRRGDFFTSVSVGPFFGELLAFQFARWLEELPRDLPSLHCVEAGAHDGRLACDILDTLEDSEPKLFTRMQYWIVEPSSARRHIQQGTLARFSNVRWFESLDEISARVLGVFFSNELLDAMPVHVFRWNIAAHDWVSMGVGVSGEQFVWLPLPSATAAPPQLPQELLAVMPDGYTVEISPAAEQWWSASANALAVGKLLTFDYVGTFEELLSPSRTSGTLRAYSRHRIGQDVLENPGEQDITAHVNFSEIRHVGELAGLTTETFTSQSQFLTTVARELWLHRGSWPQQQVRQFQTLTHPEHLGRPFRVLVQSRRQPLSVPPSV